MRRILATLRKHGMLPGADLYLPSVAGSVVGRTFGGSRTSWTHAEAKAIDEAESKLATRDDVLVVRLVKLKATYVHRDLWSDLLAVALSGDAWQTIGLPARDVRLLERVDVEGAVQFDQATSEAAESDGKLLEDRLLVIGGKVRMPSGRHDRTLTSWAAWAADHGAAPSEDLAAAYARLDAAARAFGRGAWLPWWKKPLRKRW
jgi:hypothetical protein